MACVCTDHSISFSLLGLRALPLDLDEGLPAVQLEVVEGSAPVDGCVMAVASCKISLYTAMTKQHFAKVFAPFISPRLGTPFEESGPLPSSSACG